MKKIIHQDWRQHAEAKYHQQKTECAKYSFKIHVKNISHQLQTNVLLHECDGYHQER